MLGFLLFVAVVIWFVSQFRPAKRPTWEYRWQKHWAPMFLAIGALATMAWQGFVRDPVQRAWRWSSARQESRATRLTLDDALDRMLGRDQ